MNELVCRRKMWLKACMEELVIFAEFDRINLSLIVKGFCSLGIRKLEHEVFQQTCFI